LVVSVCVHTIRATLMKYQYSSSSGFGPVTHSVAETSVGNGLTSQAP